MKSCQIKGSLIRGHVRKILQFSEAEETANTNCSIEHSVKRLTGCVSNWRILNNDWPNKKMIDINIQGSMPQLNT